MRKCLYACGLGLRSSELQHRTLSASGLGPTCKKKAKLLQSLLSILVAKEAD